MWVGGDMWRDVRLAKVTLSIDTPNPTLLMINV